MLIALDSTFGRACFGLITAYIVNWAYFTSSLSRRSVHALRRHWFTGLSFSLLHFPLSAALLLASAALAQIVVRDDVENGLRWYYGSGAFLALEL